MLVRPLPTLIKEAQARLLSLNAIRLIPIPSRLILKIQLPDPTATSGICLIRIYRNHLLRLVGTPDIPSSFVRGPTSRSSPPNIAIVLQGYSIFSASSQSIRRNGARASQPFPGYSP